MNDVYLMFTSANLVTTSFESISRRAACFSYALNKQKIKMPHKTGISTRHATSICCILNSDFKTRVFLYLPPENLHAEIYSWKTNLNILSKAVSKRKFRIQN